MRDTNQIRILDNQLRIRTKLENAYKNATKESFSYIVLDILPSSDSNYMLRTHIFPEEYTVIYK